VPLKSSMNHGLSDGKCRLCDLRTRKRVRGGYIPSLRPVPRDRDSAGR
jgi:hypothetical protein